MGGTPQLLNLVGYKVTIRIPIFVLNHALVAWFLYEFSNIETVLARLKHGVGGVALPWPTPVWHRYPNWAGHSAPDAPAVGRSTP